MWAIFQTIKRSWSQHFVSQISGFTILFISYGAAVLVALSLVNIEALFEIWGRVNKVTVYLKPGVDQQSHGKIQNYMKTKELVKNVVLVDSKMAAERFNKRFENMSSTKLDTKQLSRFFPEYYEVELNETLAYKSGSSALEAFAGTLIGKFSNIKDVSYGKSWLRRYTSILKSINYVGFLMILIFMAGALVVSSSVIKTILFSKRDEIEILEFIGASDLTIYLPQVINVVVVNGAAFILALFANQFLFVGAEDAASKVLSVTALEQLRFIPIEFCVLGFLISTFSVVLYSFFTVYRMMPGRQKVLLLKEGEI